MQGCLPIQQPSGHESFSEHLLKPNASHPHRRPGLHPASLSPGFPQGAPCVPGLGLVALCITLFNVDSSCIVLYQSPRSYIFPLTSTNFPLQFSGITASNVAEYVCPSYSLKITCNDLLLTIIYNKYKIKIFTKIIFLSDEYYLTNLDIWILALELTIPVVFIISTRLKENKAYILY